MFSFLVPIFIVGSITLGVYKVFELFARRRERIMLVERMNELTPEVSKLLCDRSLSKFKFSFSSLKCGCLLVGLGLGILLGFGICLLSIPNFSISPDRYALSTMVEAVFGASILLMGGVGLLAAFLIELRLSRSKEK